MKDLKELATGLTLALIMLGILLLATMGTDYSHGNGNLNEDGFYGILAIVCVAGLLGYKDKHR